MHLPVLAVAVKPYVMVWVLHFLQKLYLELQELNFTGMSREYGI